MGNSTVGEFIREFRRANGLSREEMAQWITKATHHHVSKTLIGILEGGGITHPRIAERMCNAMGAGNEQFDRMVNKAHRGTFRRDEKLTNSARVMRHRMFGNRRERAAADEKIEPTGNDILRIDRYGGIIGEYRTATEAADAINTSANTVRDHVKYRASDNFIRFGCVFRRRKDFTPEERRRILEIARKQLTPIKNLRAANANSIIEYNGQQKPLKVWVEDAGMDMDTVKKRLQRGVPFEVVLYSGRSISK